MTRFDWCDGEVGENVKHVLTGLLRTEVSVSNNRDCMPWIDNDPVVTMEARHKRVKERRALKDHAHKTALTEQKRKIEIQRRAKEMIKKEEQERRKRERHEEELIRTHVAAIKRQMRQQKERERFVTMVTSVLVRCLKDTYNMDTITSPNVLIKCYNGLLPWLPLYKDTYNKDIITSPNVLIMCYNGLLPWLPLYKDTYNMDTITSPNVLIMCYNGLSLLDQFKLICTKWRRKR